MAIKNFLYISAQKIKLDIFGLLILIYFSVGCQNISLKHQDPSKDNQPKTVLSQQPPSSPPLVESSKNNSVVEAVPLANSSNLNSDKVKVGLILGPGGIRSYAHIGLLQELSKAKIPIQMITGFELSALVAGIYSHKGQIFDVEWQMMKIKQEEIFKKNLVLGQSPQDVLSLEEFLKTTFGKAEVEEAKVTYFCPAFNLQKRQVYIMNRGSHVGVIPYCIPYQPFFKPYQHNVAALTSLSTSVKYMRSKGVNYILYIDLLNEKSLPFFEKNESSESISWNTVAQSLESQFQFVNKIVPITLDGIYLDDFSKRRELIKRGQDAGRQVVIDLQKELGF